MLFHLHHIPEALFFIFATSTLNPLMMVLFAAVSTPYSTLRTQTEI